MADVLAQDLSPREQPLVIFIRGLPPVRPWEVLFEDVEQLDGEVRCPAPFGVG